MTEPRIQYTKTSDGVNIAYFTVGQGPPLIMVPPIPYSHLELEWADRGHRAWDERLARGKTLVRYDNRGSGLSDREIESFDLDGLVLDIEAVVDRLGLDKIAVFGMSQGGSAAIAFAAKHPERVTHLVLWLPFDAETPLNRGPYDALKGTRDWDLFTQTIAHAMLAGWDEGDYARSYGRLMREAVDPEPVLSGKRSGVFPVAHLLSSVVCPTMVLHRREATLPPLQSGKRIAGGIPNAELVVLEGGVPMPWVGDMEGIARTVDRFLGIRDEPAPAASAAAPATSSGTLATILFTDVEGSTALTDRLGDAAAREVLREHERITREALKTHGGSEVKTMGDGFMASFGSATKALECAIAIQKAFDAPGTPYAPKAESACALA